MNELVQKQDTELKAVEQVDPVFYAMQNGATMEQLEKMMELKERHEANEAKKAFVKAMAKFRGLQQPILKTRKGHNCKYAGLAETIEQVTPLLMECGLSHRWEQKQENAMITVTCYVTHVDGHSESSTLSSAPDNSGGKNSIQSIGSANSYLQRYTLFSVLGLSSREDDDDGKNSGAQFINENQYNEIHALLTENDIMDKTIAWLGKKNIKSLSEIPFKDYPLILSTIRSSLK